MKLIHVFAVGAVCLPLGACCFGGHHSSSSSNEPKVDKVDASDIVKADPSRMKSVHKVAFVSMSGECDVEIQGGGVAGLTAMKHAEARLPASIDAGVDGFVAELQKDTGWTMPTKAEVVGNPAYAANTFDPDLHVQTRQIKHYACTGGGYRMLNRYYSKQAGAIATALGVDAVVMEYVDEHLTSNGIGAVSSKAGILFNVGTTVVGPDGQVLWEDHTTVRPQEVMSAGMGNVDWAQIPTYAAKTLILGAQQVAADWKKDGGG